MNEYRLRKKTLLFSHSINLKRVTVSCVNALKGLFAFALTLILITGFAFNEAQAQDRISVSGVVTDAQDGTPIPGVNVIVPGAEDLTGSTIGTTTNINGEYTLQVPEELNELSFSFIGYQSQIVQIDGRTQINVQMQQDIQLLEDVIVVGYGTQRRQDATGAVVSITERDFNTGLISSPEQLLQGRTAGVQITTASGEPGAGANIRIRGTSSVRGGNQPLIVVDGVPLSGENLTPGGQNFGAGSQSPRNPLSFLNPDDIENISILKDASAAAIYGSRGSNGVILITTKRGGTAPNLTLSSSTSFSSPAKKLDLLTASEYVSAAQAAGADPEIVNFGAATDWQDQIFRNTVSQDYNISYGDGTETGSYRLSLGYADQQGIIEMSSLERITARINADQQLMDNRINLNLSLTASRLNDRYAPVGNTAGFQGDLVGAALQANPTRPVFNTDGTYYQTADFRNPAAMLSFVDDRSETSRILFNMGGSLSLTDWLLYRVNIGYENSEAARRLGIHPSLGQSAGFSGLQVTNGRADIDNLYINSQLIEHTMNLQQHFAGGEFEALAGFSYQRFERRGNWMRAEYFITDQIPFVDNIGGVDNVNQRAYQASSHRNKDELQSFFGRLNYNYDDRYLVTANFRADGSTKFGRNNRYGYFPSLAFAWRVSNEDFFAGLSETFSDLRLRGGYGITGNQEFESGASLARFRTNPDGSLTQQNNPNPNIQWEETVQWGIGIDIELFNGRFGGTLDFFDKTTKNLIFRADYAQPAAVDFQWVNLDGEVLNRGVEFSLFGFAVDRARFSWRIDYNMSFLENEVKKLPTFVNTGQIHGQGLSGAYAQRITEGRPLFAFFLREFGGFDENGLGIYPNGDLLTYAGSPIPDMTLGLNNTFNIGRFNLSAFIEGSFGFKVYNNTSNAIFLMGNLRNARNVTRDVANSPESSNNFGEVSTRFLEDGDYVRLANVNLGYNVDVSRLEAVRNLRIGVTGQNLLLITNYSGFDPEVNTDKSIGGVPSLGIDYTPYPRPRVFTFNVRVDI